MTKANREKAYKHFRDLQENYVAPEGRNHSATSTSCVRQRAQALAERMLVKNPELNDPLPSDPSPGEDPKPGLTPAQKAAKTKAAKKAAAKKAAEAKEGSDGKGN